MKKIVLGLLGLLSLSIYAQDTTEVVEEFIPIEVEGKEAFISTKTGEYTYRAHKETNAEHLKTTPSGVVYTEIKYHEVKKGETLFAIAKQHNTTVAQLKQSNKAAVLKLKPGLKLKVESKTLLKSSSPVIGTSGKERIIAKLPPGESPGALAPPPPIEEIEKKLVKTNVSQEKPNQKSYKVKTSVKNPILSTEVKPEKANKTLNETAEAKKERLAQLKSEMAALEAELKATENTNNSKAESTIETETVANKTIIEESKPKIIEGNCKKVMVFENNTEEELAKPEETTAAKAARIIEEVRNTKKEQVINKTDETTPNKTITKTGFYTVKKDNSLWSIARQHGMTVEEIKKLNGLKNNNISVGQKLKVKSTSK